MKLTKRLFALALVLCMVFLCTACAKNVTFKKHFKDETYTDPNPTLNAMSKVDLLDEMSVSANSRNLLLLRNQEAFSLYNLSTNSIVLTLDRASTIEYKFFSVNGTPFFAVELLEEAKEDGPSELAVSESSYLCIYNASGTEVARGKANMNTVDVELDMFSYDGVIYRVAEDGTVSTVSSNPFIGALPSLDDKTDNYYYSYGDNSVTIYDKSLNTVLFWEAPSDDSEGINAIRLGDNVLVQSAIEVPEMDEDYDCYIDGEKYNLDSVILNPKKGSAKSVDLDYVASMRYDDEYVYIAKIEDRRLQTATSALQIVSLKPNNGKIASVLFSDLFGVARMIAANRFLYTAHNGDTYLLNEKGETLSKMNAVGEMSQRNASFFLFNNTVYNYDLREIYSIDEKNQYVEMIMGHSVVFQDFDGAYTLLDKSGSTTKLNPEAKEYIFNKQYYVAAFDGYYNFFNEDGTVLASDVQGSNYRLVSSYDNVVIISVINNNVREYYRITK